MKKQEEVASVLGPPFWLILDVVNEGNWNPAGHVIIVMVTVPFWVPDFQNTILISFELAKYYCFCLLIHIPHLFFHILSPLVNIKRRLLKHSMFSGRSLVCPNFLCFISYWSMPHHPQWICSQIKNILEIAKSFMKQMQDFQSFVLGTANRKTHALPKSPYHTIYTIYTMLTYIYIPCIYIYIHHVYMKQNHPIHTDPPPQPAARKQPPALSSEAKSCALALWTSPASTRMPAASQGAWVQGGAWVMIVNYSMV